MGIMAQAACNPLQLAAEIHLSSSRGQLALTMIGILKWPLWVPFTCGPALAYDLF